MRSRLVWLLAATLILVAVAAAGVYGLVAIRFPDVERAALQGDWRVVAWGSRDGAVERPSPPFDEMVLTVRGNQIVSKGDGKPMAFRLYGDAGDLKRVDFSAPYESEPDPGVYRLDGDTLVVCLANHRGLPRPTDLQLLPGSDARWLVRLQRVARNN